MVTKLKTLKEMGFNKIDSRINEILKEEALKWYCALKDYSDFETIKKFKLYDINDFIKHFFDLEVLKCL